MPARLVRYMCPSILFSSSREEIVEGYTLGANSYVTKPASFDRFSEAMQYLGWYGLYLDESPWSSWRPAKGQRSCGTALIMNPKTPAHWCTSSMEGKESGENPLSRASLQIWVLVKTGLRTLPTVFLRPSNARRTSARNGCRWWGATSGGSRLAALSRHASTFGFG